MQNVLSVNSVQQPVVSFKRQERPYNPQAGIPTADRYQPTQQKQKSNRDGWSKAGVVFNGALAAAFITIAVTGLLTYLGKGKGASKIEDNLMDAATDVKLTFRDCRAEKKECVDLDSDTTAPAIRKMFMNLINLEKLSPKAKKWCGLNKKGQANFLFLYGYGGTGKSYVAQQLAEKQGAYFTLIKCTDVGSIYKDAAPKKVENMFKKIAEFYKAHPDRKGVVCIDESDTIIRKVADGANGAEEAGKVRGAMLTGMDYVAKECPNVTFIMTSNYHPQSGYIDSTVYRRLKYATEVPLGDFEQRMSMLKLGLKDIEGKPGGEEFFGRQDVKDFVEKNLKDYSNGEILKICESVPEMMGEVVMNNSLTDEQLANHLLTVDMLEAARKLKGAPAKLTCYTMKPDPALAALAA